MSAREHPLDQAQRERSALTRPTSEQLRIAELRLEIAEEVDREPDPGSSGEPGVALRGKLAVRKGRESARQVAERGARACGQLRIPLAFLDHDLDGVAALHERLEEAGERAVEVRREQEEENPEWGTLAWARGIGAVISLA